MKQNTRMLDCYLMMGWMDDGEKKRASNRAKNKEYIGFGPASYWKTTP